MARWFLGQKDRDIVANRQGVEIEAKRRLGIRICGETTRYTGLSIYLSIYLSLLSRSFSDHHLRCGGWLNLEFSKREKHSGWAI